MHILVNSISISPSWYLGERSQACNFLHLLNKLRLQEVR